MSGASPPPAVDEPGTVDDDDEHGNSDSVSLSLPDGVFEEVEPSVIADLASYLVQVCAEQEETTEEVVQPPKVVPPTNSGTYNCTLCSESFISPTNLVSHLVYDHKKANGPMANGELPPNLNPCLVNTEASSTVQDHLQTHRCEAEQQTTPDAQSDATSRHCTACLIAFQEPVSLLLHLANYHPESKQYLSMSGEGKIEHLAASNTEMIDVEDGAPSLEAFTRRASKPSDNKKKQWICELCLELFFRKHELKRHRDRRHQATRPITEAFNWIGTGPSRASGVQPGATWKCEVCNKLLSTKYSLLKHLKTVHKLFEPPPAETEPAKVQSTSLEDISQSIAASAASTQGDVPSVHPFILVLPFNTQSPDPETTSTPPESSASNGYLSSEADETSVQEGSPPESSINQPEATPEIVPNDGWHRCTVCPAMYKSTARLLLHLARYHPTSKQYLTLSCEAEKDRQASTSGHEAGDESDSNSVNLQADGIFHACNQCTGIFRLRSDLDRHMITHGGPRSDLERPQIAHGGPRSWACDACQTLFMRKTDLEKHREERHQLTDPVTEERHGIGGGNSSDQEEIYNRPIIRQKKSVSNLSINPPPTGLRSGRDRGPLPPRPARTETSFQAKPPQLRIPAKVSKFLQPIKSRKKRKTLVKRKSKRKLKVNIDFAGDTSLWPRPGPWETEVGPGELITVTQTGPPHDRRVTCPFCPLQKRKGSLYKHLYIHILGRPWRCPLCPSTFDTHSQLRYHRESFHPTELTDDQLWLSQPQSLPEGEVSHFDCPLCPASSYVQETLQAHLEAHTVFDPELCEVCGIPFLVRDELGSHRIDAHGLTSEIPPKVVRERPEDEDEEGRPRKKKRTNKGLTIHLPGDTSLWPRPGPWESEETGPGELISLVLTGPPATRLVSCPFCPLQKKTGSLTKHLATNHIVGRSWSCPLCTSSYDSLAYLKEHRNRRHEDQLTDEQLLSSQRPDPKEGESRRLDCPFCPASSYADETIKAHIEAHTTIDPERCEACGIPFVARDDLLSHRSEAHGLTSEAPPRKVTPGLYIIRRRRRRNGPKLDKVDKVVEPKITQPYPTPADGWHRCTVCPGMFQKFRSLLVHLSRDHPDSEQYATLRSAKEGNNEQLSEEVNTNGNEQVPQPQLMADDSIAEDVGNFMDF